MKAILFDVYGTLISIGNGSVSAVRKIYTSESLMAYKPNPKFYLTILSECGYSVEDVLYVGDSIEEDIIAPSKLGIKTAFVDRNNLGNNYGQVFSVRDMMQLCPMLDC